jgi:formylglycine-generating enzyme required for sulfatase activity
MKTSPFFRFFLACTLQGLLFSTPVWTQSGSYTETVKGVSFRMIAVDAGAFFMGCTHDQMGYCDSMEFPEHAVTLSKYYIGETEVTQALWMAVMGNNPSSLPHCPTCPVDQLSWYHTQEFIQRLNELTGKAYRLPTEAEWEFAARGGNASRELIFSGSNNATQVMWPLDFSSDFPPTKPVKGKKANELGLYDMSGNVQEWCEDWYYRYTDKKQVNPIATKPGRWKVVRGGHLNKHYKYCRSASRSFADPKLNGPDDYRYFGFRLASPM